MQDIIIKDIKIDNPNDFIQTNKFFDLTYNSTSYVGCDSIATMLKRFPLDSANDFTLNSDTQIRQNIDIVFSHSDMFDIKNYVDFKYKKAIRFFNHIYCLLCDIKEDKPLISPFSVTKYANGYSQIHPGAKRILLHDVYTAPVKYIVTDFTPSPPKMHDVKTFDFDWSLGNYWISFRQRGNRYYKELFGIPYSNSKKDFLSVEYVEDRIFCYTGYTVMVNDTVIMQKQNDVWRVVIE